MKGCLKFAVLTVAVATVMGTSNGRAQEALAAKNSDEVEALRKQNSELQQRVEKLAGDLEQVKVQLAAKAVTQPAPARPSNPKFDVALYGYVKLDAAYDDSRVSVGNYARWVESEQVNRNDNEFNMTANETRFGIRIRGPQSDTFRSTGIIEADFYGGGTENAPNPRLRLAYVNFEWPGCGFGVLAGQAKDTISPLYQPRVNFSPGWWQGNLDFRRPQLRLIENLKLAERVELKLEAAAARTIAPAFAAPKDFFPDPGADAGYPSAQGRVSLTFPGLYKLPVTLGVSGHWGEDEHDFTNFTHSVHFKSWSGNVDLSLPLTPWLKLQGEAYVGANLDAYLGGIGQGVNITRLIPIRDRGGWAALTLGPFDRWVFNFGAGIDDVNRNDLTGTGVASTDPRASNKVAFGNTYYSLSDNLQLALEGSYLRTSYKSVAPGDDWRVQFAVIYKF
ncbi:MAG TPA: DcaP family trimeric outer membrane transporter [Verrucomicrobiae bacterium]|jgi:hypothetical protein